MQNEKQFLIAGARESSLLRRDDDDVGDDDKDDEEEDDDAATLAHFIANGNFLAKESAGVEILRDRR